jgi:hypothetical protein
METLDHHQSDDNAYAHLRGAASGDLEAMRALVSMGLGQICDEPVPDITTAIETLIFARMASTVGTQADTGKLMCLLGLTVDMLDGVGGWSEYRDNLLGEGIAIASRLADDGVEVVEQMLPAMVEGAGPRAAEMAKDILTRMGAI